MKVIAEIGSNWRTELEAVASIAAAKRCGADIVKFQYYTNHDLYGVSGPSNCIPSIRALSNVAREVGIEFMCTGFSPEAYQLINPWVERHKIASSEITAINILETVAKFGKPVLLSTGGATIDEIDRAVEILKPCPTTILYCVVEYPARVVDFRNIERLRRRYGGTCDVGYSDHSTDVLNVPTMALICGATVLEKHVNFSAHTDTPDAPHSLSEAEFSMMVRVLKNELGEDETFRPNPWKRRAVAMKDGTVGYYRPLNVD